MSQPLDVQMVRLPHAHDLPLPQQMTEHAAGFDVVAAIEEDVVIAPREIRLIPLGFAIAVPVGFELQMRPRSGLAAKHGIGHINSPGTIDADYRGEVFVPLINHSDVAFTVTRGMRIAQMVVCPVPPVRLREVAELPPSGRGLGGFGSTGR